MSMAFVLAVFVVAIAGTAIPAQAQTYTDLHDFNPGAGDPYNFDSGRLSQGRDGNFYGESANGGTSGAGTVFQLTPSGAAAIIHSFTGTDGSSPHGGLTLGVDGNFYGDAVSGGSSNYGSIFKVTPAGTLTVLHNFSNTGDGYNPYNALVLGLNGNFYGTTNSNPETIYQITPAGTFKTVHTLTASEGYQGGQLTVGRDGKLYGAMNLGGANGFGEAFKMTTSGSLTVLHNFDSTDGADAASGMVQAANGKFYGGASLGGSSNAGVIYSVTSAGTFAVLHDLNGATDGYEPFGELILASDGNMYGTTNAHGSSNCGTIFQVTPAGSYSVIYNFDNTHGCNPREQVLQGTNGLLYGLVNSGGANGNGAFYSLNAGLSSFISLMSASGVEGAKVEILGQGFSNASVVKFGGTAASIIAVTGTTYITATVPAGALTGSIAVTTGATTLNSLQTFKVLPTITGFTPPSGPVGTPVVITGTGLKQATLVKFGSVKATSFTVNSDTQVTADVPAGAITATIHITTKGGAAVSKTKFTVN